MMVQIPVHLLHLPQVQPVSVFALLLIFFCLTIPHFVKRCNKVLRTSDVFKWLLSLGTNRVPFLMHQPHFLRFQCFCVVCHPFSDNILNIICVRHCIHFGQMVSCALKTPHTQRKRRTRPTCTA